MTVTEPVPPEALYDSDAGKMEYEQVTAPPWFTVKVLPAAVIVPDRGLAELLAAKPYATVPFPDPDEPDVTVIHAALLDAVHGQEAVAVTENEPDPPLGEALADVGLME